MHFIQTKIWIQQLYFHQDKTSVLGAQSNMLSKERQGSLAIKDLARLATRSDDGGFHAAASKFCLWYTIRAVRGDTTSSVLLLLVPARASILSITKCEFLIDK